MRVACRLLSQQCNMMLTALHPEPPIQPSSTPTTMKTFSMKFIWIVLNCMSTMAIGGRIYLLLGWSYDGVLIFSPANLSTGLPASQRDVNQSWGSQFLHALSVDHSDGCKSPILSRVVQCHADRPSSRTLDPAYHRHLMRRRPFSSQNQELISAIYRRWR